MQLRADLRQKLVLLVLREVGGQATDSLDEVTATRSDLASGHQGTIAAVRRVHVTFHIRVAENREAPQRGHGGNRMKTQRGDSRQSDSGSQIFCINAM